MNFLSLHAILFLAILASPSPESYRLEPGDEVDVGLRSGARILMEAKTVRVAPDGHLYLPFGGKVDVRGKTDQQIRDAIAKESQRVMRLRREPSVEFFIRTLVPRYRDSVGVIGAVSEPGTIAYQDGMTLKMAITQAGGFLPKVNVQQVRLIRKDRVTLLSSTDALIGDPSGTALEPGDIVDASAVSRPVTVFGLVASPGPVDWFDGMRVSDAVALAGGVDFAPKESDAKAPQQADVGSVRVIRGTTEIPVNLTPLFSPPFNLADIPLVQPGDHIYVPPLRDRCTVIGAVGQSGSFPLGKDDRILDVLGRAGLAMNQVDRGGDIIIRGRTEERRIPANRLLVDGDLQFNVPVHAGDLIVIPFAGSVSVVGEVKQPGVFPLDASTRVYHLIYRAGGPTDHANLDNISILRDGKPLAERLRLDPTQQGAEQPELRPGDVILVPPRDGVYVVGAVNLPGFVPHQEQMTLLDAFTRARWLNPAADIKKVSIVRVHQGKIVTLAPDVQALINRNDRSQNVALNSGDTVIVPFRRPSQTSFLNQFNPLSLFGYVAPFVYR